VDLIRRGRRVGVAATSHKAIHNLLDEVGRAAREVDVSVRGLKKCSAGNAETEYRGDWVADVDDTSELIERARRASSWPARRRGCSPTRTWTAAPSSTRSSSTRPGRCPSPTRSRWHRRAQPDPARRSSQLAQVSQGTHPEGVGASVLEHLLGDHLTVPEDCGIFLDRTRRMHPDVCRFVSEIVYDNRLVGLPDLANQTTRRSARGCASLPVEHAGNVASAPEEAARIATRSPPCEARRGPTARGTAPAQRDHFMVVAPVQPCSAPAAPHLAGRRAGRRPRRHRRQVPGREAPVVFYSMATSSAETCRATLDFLFSRNRLNVAVSRAMCLACIVASPRLLESRARTIEQMRLINALCRFGRWRRRKRRCPRLDTLTCRNRAA